MEHMAYHDSLTSLPNRRYIESKIDEKSLITNNNLAILYLDLDQFKLINDSLGHHTGDAVLVELASRLRRTLKTMQYKHFITRYGGDSFVICLNNIPSKDTVVLIAEEIQRQIKEPFNIQSKQIDLTASIGIVHTEFKPNDQLDQILFNQLIKNASIALRFSKMNGGNTYSFNTDKQNKDIERLYKMERDISHALEKEQFFLVYQPLVRLKDHEIIGVEALLRWKHPKLGIIPPNKFIPILEEKGYIVLVGEWIIKTVCKQMNKWLSEGTSLEFISVNVSPVQFSSKDFVTKVSAIINQTGLEGKHLELEVTESTIQHIKEPKKIFEQLKELGIKISIDDFGTGYSSLSRLNEMPIDTLKIDKSFIDHLDCNGQIIVDTIISMGKSLKYKIVAEGIETNKQLMYLKQQQCHLGQGFYFSKPVKADKISMLIDALK